MAKFMVKASEFKNVCKAVNDRKLAELKKEIIEILKKQDEKDFKKATDYLNSQEEHFTHLEKSFSGKWIEKAGYGIGTVRVWKGKKYKKIAPDKWVRVFDKEGRGTNIAIGKLIAKVNKIDNVEDLMAFVMANKQRFVDENGMDLPVLDKLRAAVGVKNENLSGESSSYTYGVGEDVSREKNKIFEGKEKITKEEADLHKVSRKFSQMPTTELKQRKAKLERWIENKTRNKRDSLNNAIFRESYQKELDAINAVLDKRNGKKETSKPTEKKTVQGVKILSKDEIHNLTKGEVQDYRKELHDAMKKLDYGADDFDILYATKKIADDTWHNKEYKDAVDSDKNIKEFAAFLKENNLHQHDKIEYKGKDYVVQYDSQGGDGDLLWIPPVFDDSEFDVSKIKIKNDESEEEKTQNRSEAMKGNKNAYKGGAKEVVGTFSKVDDNTVEMPLTKDAKKLFESLNKTRSNDKHRQFMADAYYDGENLVSTDGRRLTVIKAGDIGLEKGYVNVKTDNGKITVEHNAEKTKENQFPNYSKVIPDNNNQEVNLNKKDLLNKLKEMKQDGAYTKKEPSITLEFNDGDVILDGTVIGKSDAEFEGENKYIRINAEYLKDAVSSSDNSTMFVSDNPEKAISFSDNNSNIIVMPMNNSEKDNYKERRNSKKERDDWESEQKKQHQDAMNNIVDTQKESMSDGWVQSLINRVNNKEMDNHKAIIEHSYKALKEAEKMIDKPTKNWTSSLTNNKYGFSLLAATRKNPEFKTALENMANEYGLIKKSLFDDFIIDNFIEEDIDDIEEEKEEESLWNDYSAEQPELFNSVELQVTEAMNRHFGNCL